jgi:signal transduction histidine kinase
MDTSPFQHDADRPGAQTLRQWEEHAPAFRRWSARMGLQGKLIFAFMYVLVLAIGASCWLFGSQSSERISDIMGEQARQISYALSLAAKSSFEQRNQTELSLIGHDLIKTRNVLFVAFLGPDGQKLATANRDPSFQWHDLESLRLNTRGLMQVHEQQSPVLGEYLAVMSPVLSVSSPAAVRLGASSADGASRLLGYVVVGLSQTHEQAMLRQINFLVMLIGGAVILLSLPLSYAIVHRIFLPIRQLVTATDQIAAGDLKTQVAIHRPDVIGTLARSFNEMVLKVRAQQTALEEANSDLEHKVLERTGQLETANKRLSCEIAEKEDFLRAISHDLNAPLRNIAGMASMLLLKNRERFDEDIIHRLERIQKNVQVETDLISELLELSRIKTRRQKIETVEIDAMVRELGEVFENDLKSRDIALIVDQHLPVLNCEKARFRQVFQNLIDNAIKYMGSGPVREIHVGCHVHGSEAEFYVRDTGIGIEPEDIGKVFFVFRRGKSQAVQNVSGKGVGLASVKSIVETYSGTIWVESQPGHGSTFKFTVNGMHLMQPSEASAIAA